MTRVMVNLEDDMGEAVKAKAEKERRSLSSYVVVLIEKDLRAAGLIGATKHDELLSAAEDIGHDRALQLLTAARRKTRKYARRAA